MARQWLMAGSSVEGTSGSPKRKQRSNVFRNVVRMRVKLMNPNIWKLRSVWTGDIYPVTRARNLCISMHSSNSKCTLTSSGNVKVKGPLGRPKHRCEDNIRKDVREI
jgi:hypothetical protein